MTRHRLARAAIPQALCALLAIACDGAQRAETQSAHTDDDGPVTHAKTTARIVRSTAMIGGSLSARQQPLRGLSVTLPETGDGALRLQRDAVEVSIRSAPLDVATVGVVGNPVDGMTIYPSIATDLDRVLHAGGDVVEELWVLRSQTAPRRFALEVEGNDRVAAIRAEGDRIAIVDTAGRVVLTTEALLAEDANGQRRRVRMETEPGPRQEGKRARVILSIDTAGLAYPIVVDPAWTPLPAMPVAVTASPGFVLSSGLVLLANAGVLFNPATNAWTRTSPSPPPGSGNFGDGLPTSNDPPSAAALLNDGSVLEVTQYGAGAARYVPSTNAFTATSNAPSAAYASVAAIPSGAVAACAPQYGLATSTSSIYLSAMGVWSSAGNLNTARVGCSLVSLPSGKVLLLGGGSNQTELFDPSTSKWSYGPLSTTGGIMHATLASGRILVIGGTSAEIYDPVSNTFAPTASPPLGQSSTTPVTLPNGQVLVAGGLVGGAISNVVQRYDPSTGKWTTLPTLISARLWPTVTALPTGQALVAGGWQKTGVDATRLISAELYGATLGTPCASALECASGYCTDGVCCSAGSCSPGAYCSTPTKAGTCAKPLGTSCAGTSECESGFCVDGVCCSSACGSQCAACDVPGQVGTCFPVLGAPHGARSACGGTGAGTACGASCDGTNAASCTFPGSTTACGTASCTSGVAKAVASCQGDGTCKDASSSCGAYACGATSCLTSCTSSADCAAGYACKAGACAATVGLGASCASAADCASGYCTDGVCCGVALCEVGSSCALGAAPGTCAKKLGVACKADAECGSGGDGAPHCVDGVCCDTACAGQCEACDAPTKFGTCTPIGGAPHGSRSACDDGGADACKATSCDGSDATKCAKYVHGSETICAPAACAGNSFTGPSTCDGAGACAMPTTSRCTPYRCDNHGCFTQCVRNSECDDGYACDGGACKAIVAKCSADATASTATDGTVTECAPYRCTTLGGCGTSCATSADCALGASCDVTSKACVAPASTARSGGCAVEGGANAPAASATMGLAALVCVGWAGRRRRRRGSVDGLGRAPRS